MYSQGKTAASITSLAVNPSGTRWQPDSRWPPVAAIGCVNVCLCLMMPSKGPQQLVGPAYGFGEHLPQLGQLEVDQPHPRGGQ